MRQPNDLPAHIVPLWPDRMFSAEDFHPLIKKVVENYRYMGYAPWDEVPPYKHVVGTTVFHIVYDNNHMMFGIFEIKPITLDFTRTPHPSFTIPLTDVAPTKDDGGRQAGRLAPEDLHQPGVLQL
jgi:hypothetical protein